MFYFQISTINQQDQYQEFCLVMSNLDAAFEFLTRLVQSGCHLIQLRLINQDGLPTFLPVEAFDGCPMEMDLHTLQQQWEAALVV